ncbi:MAG TPA: glycosyl hydrolase, partial [Clostridia bacterium]|nr:glycosyl hydrolase [Clostridia bacterium]
QSCKGKPTLKDWELLTGKTYTAPVVKKGRFTMNNTVMEMKDYSFVMKIMVKVVERIVAKVNGCKVDYDNPDFRMMINSSLGAPLRSMQIAGGVKDGIMQGLLDMANGHFFRGIGKMIKG